MKTDIQSTELHTRLSSGEDFVIVDVRTPLEFAMGHIRGALNIPLSKISGTLPGVEPSAQVVLVCQGGVRSAQAYRQVETSYPNLYDLPGGMVEWKESGIEVETGPKAPRSLERQTHFVAGLLLVLAFVLSSTVDPRWIYLAMLPAFGLMLDAMTGICPMTLILKRMPWNQ